MLHTMGSDRDGNGERHIRLEADGDVVFICDIVCVVCGVNLYLG